MSTNFSQPPCVSLEENLKKALTELLLLHLLSQKPYYVGELTEALKQQSRDVLKLVFPYSAIYRLQKEGYIVDDGKRIAQDGRKRQFYRISEDGQTYYREMLATYRRFMGGIDLVLNTP